jgi:hypothetical protein
VHGGDDLLELAQRERLLHSQPAAPEHDDQRAQPEAVSIVPVCRVTATISSNGRRVRGIEPPLVAGRAAGVVARQRRRRAPQAGGIENGKAVMALLPSARRTEPGALPALAHLARRSRSRFAPATAEAGRLVDETADARPDRA